MTSPLTFTIKSIDGKDVNLAQFKGKVVLIVNVASKCGYTNQYEGLQKLYETYGKDGLVVIGVPSNDFGRQEPGTNEEIAAFCSSKYKVTFPMMAKVVVKGKGIDPLYKYLTSADSGYEGEISWNFEKFLVAKDGQVVGRFKPSVKPLGSELEAAIKAELAK